MKIDLSDVNKGTIVFHVAYGYDRVETIRTTHAGKKFVVMENVADCEIDGTMWQHGTPKHPSVFHGIPECREYFNSLYYEDELEEFVEKERNDN